MPKASYIAIYIVRVLVHAYNKAIAIGSWGVAMAQKFGKFALGDRIIKQFYTTENDESENGSYVGIFTV